MPREFGHLHPPQPIPASLGCHLFSFPTGTEGIFRDTHWYYSLQADVEVLFLVGFEFFQGNSGFSDELVVAEFVLVTHGDPGGKRKKGMSTRLEQCPTPEPNPSNPPLIWISSDQKQSTPKFLVCPKKRKKINIFTICFVRNHKVEVS